ncbi:MAG: glyceraldehyde 3-phosphate dehydrogenase NAD-binding domain-containing protein, partial [Pseudomonadota bacterium]
MARIAINGIGRIGKLVLRALVEEGGAGEIVLLNDAVGDPAQHAHLLEFDTVHGRWAARFDHDGESVSVNGHRMRMTGARAIADLPLRELGVDLVIDCTGVFKTVAKVQPYYDAGVAKVVVSAPVKEAPALNLVYGVNNDAYTGQSIVTAASCTTNCLAPVVKVIHDGLGIRHGSITTIHDV